MTEKTHLLVAATVRDGLRWARQHVYALLVLTPLIVGMLYLTLAQMTSYDLRLAEPSPLIQILSAAAFVTGAMMVSLSRASRELYHLARPTVFTEALALSRSTHLNFALLIRAGHTLLLCLGLLLLHSFLSVERIGIESLLVLAIFCALLTVSESFAALNWIHWGHVRAHAAAIKSVALLIISSLTNSLLLVLFFNKAVAARWAQALHLPGAAWTGAAAYATGIGLITALYLLTRASHRRWRAVDIDYARRLEQRGWPELSFRGILPNRLTRAVRALLTRDLSLTVRVFSSAVYVAAGISLLILLLLLTLLLSGSLPSAEVTLGGLRDLGWLSATWLPASLAIKASSLLVVTCLCSIVPVLVSHQIPHAWLERAVGVTGNDLWQAKVWFARLITLPPVIAIYVAGVLACLISGLTLPPSYLLPLLAECLWLWWLASSITGALAFEMPDRPGLALALILSLCLSTGVLAVVLWPMGLGIYGMGVEQAKDRGLMQAVRYLSTEEQ